jgi:hypothetical protein
VIPVLTGGHGASSRSFGIAYMLFESFRASAADHF